MPSWSDLNAKFVLPARRLLLGGRAPDAEELLRRGVDETGDGWVMYQLAETILVQTPTEPSRIEEAAGLYARSLTRLPNEGYRRLAEAALAKAKAMLTLAPSKTALPKSLLPSADARPAARPEEPVDPDAVPPPPDPLVEKLKALFHHEAFRPGQREVIDAVMKGRHALAVMPTGGGKSLLYEFPAQMLEGPTIVVSPLISLMRDQEARLRSKGITNATTVNSSLDFDEVRARLTAFREGKTRMLYVAPERFANDGFLTLVQGMKLSLMAIDEAHCVSEWGHNFRPDYLRLREVIARTKPTSVLAVTATATPRVRQEITEKLGLANPYVYVGSFDRPNLVWSVMEGRELDKGAALKRILGEVQGSAIVYTSRRADADSVARLLQSGGIPALAYHAGMEAEARSHAEEQWRSGRARVMAATIAFGMGIDKADVRAVVHWQMPASLEDYVQQAGRAGRDGKPSQCVLLHDPEDKGFQHWAIEQSYPDRTIVLEVLEGIGEGLTLDDLGQLRDASQVTASVGVLERQGFIDAIGPKQYERSPEAPTLAHLDLSELERKRHQAEDRLRAMERYADAKGCRRRVLLEWFGERLAPDWQCAGCDRCRKAREGGDDAYKSATMRQAVLDGVRELESRHLTVPEMARAMLFLAPPNVTRALKGKNEAEVRDLLQALLREGDLELDARVPWVKRRR